MGVSSGTGRQKRPPILVHWRILRIHILRRVWYAVRMAQAVCPIVCGEDRARLAAIVADRNRAQKHVLRARIVLHSADRLSVAEVARRAGVGRPAVWRWQRRYAVAGVDGLLREATASRARRRRPRRPCSGSSR